MVDLYGFHVGRLILYGKFVGKYASPMDGMKKSHPVTDIAVHSQLLPGPQVVGLGLGLRGFGFFNVEDGKKPIPQTDTLRSK